MYLSGASVCLPQGSDGFEERFESVVLFTVDLFEKVAVEFCQRGIWLKASAGSGHGLACLNGVAVLSERHITKNGGSEPARLNVAGALCGDL